MKAVKVTVIAIAAVLAAACTAQEAEIVNAERTEDETEVEMESCYEQGSVTVKFTEEMAAMVEAALAEGSVTTRSSELNELISDYGVTSIKRVFSDDERWLERQHREGLHLWYDITYDQGAAPVTKAAGEFGKIPGIELAEPNPKVKLTASYYYDDTYYSKQWHLNGKYGINVEDVWDGYTKGSSDVIVSVVDEGIDLSHPDLAANTIAAGSGGSKNFVNSNYTMTSGGHGTHVAGIISAVSNNGVGVAGIAGGDYAEGIDGVKLLSCMVFKGDDSASTSQFGEAIKYGADNGALISQNSWGFSYDTESQAKSSTTPSSITTAIDYFVKYAGCDNSGNQLSGSLMKGGIVVFAAGNDGWQYGHPGDYESCMAVGATTSTGTRAYYSNYGSWVDICAPGSDVYSTYYSSGSTYSSLSGTSMACPMVSGVAALVISKKGGQGFTADDLWSCLIDGADASKGSATNVGPYLDALGAVTYGVDMTPDPITSCSASSDANVLHVTFTVPAADETGKTPAYGAIIYVGTDKSTIDGLDPTKTYSDLITSTVLTGSYAVGEEATQDFTVDFGTTYYITCVSYNSGPHYADKCGTVSVTTQTNNPPTITPSIDLSEVFEVGASKQGTITFTIADPDGHDVTVAYTSKSIAEKWAKTGTDTYTLTITGYAKDSSGNLVEPGEYSPQIIATDQYGLSCDPLGFTYRILENRAPQVSASMENVLLKMDSSATKTASVGLADCFTDPDDDELTYTIENTSSSTVQAILAYNTVNGVVTPSLNLTAQKAGTATITVIASDAAGLTCSQSMTVLVMAAGESISAYPNPCTTVLNVTTDATTATSTDVSFYTANGTLAQSGVYSASAFEPAQISVSSLSPATYTLIVKYGTTEVTKKIIKQ